MKSFGLFSLLFAVSIICFFTGGADAKVIERSFTLDVQESSMFDTVDEEGNQGEVFFEWLPVTPFTVGPSDIIKTQITFVNPIKIEQLPGNGYFTDEQLGMLSAELIYVSYEFDEGSSETEISSTCILNVLDGDVVDTLLYHVGHAGPGFGVFTTWPDNGFYTDSYYIIDGISIETEIISVEQIKTVDSLYISLEASELTVIGGSSHYDGGDGTQWNPYQINTAEQLQLVGTFSEDWDKHFVLTADIDMFDYTGADFNIIGVDYENPFTGVFDGDGHTITNFSYTSIDENHVGIFGYLDDEGRVENLGVVGCNIDTGEGEYAGGLLASNLGGYVYNCFTTGSVAGGKFVGGLVGRNSEIISNCYSMADVSGSQYVGGLVGYNNTLVMSCYSTGFVSGILNTGGLVGRTHRGVTYNSYWDISTSGQTDGEGGRGRTTEQMLLLNTYVGWGAEQAWKLDDGVDYPRLIWEGAAGQEIIDPASGDLYGGGNGTEELPYLIYTPQQFNNIGLVHKDWDKHFKLMADIDLSVLPAESYNIIGIDYEFPFSGQFDGDGHSIAGFNYTEGQYLLGLWGLVYSDDAVIKNLTLISPVINSPGSEWVGLLVGELYRGRVINCHVVSGSVTAQSNVGGLIGRNSYGYIISCSSDCDVNGPSIAAQET